MNYFLPLHNLLRWAVLLFGLWAIINAISGIMSKKDYSAKDRKIGLFFMISCDIQLLIGLFLYFNNNWFSQLKTDTKTVMANSALRFFAMEHALMMIIAWLLVHIGISIIKRADTDAKKHKKTLIFFGITLLLIIAMIPWPFRAVDIMRPLFRNF